MRALLWCLTILCGASAQKFLYLSLNDVCKDGPDTWRCKTLSACPALKEAIRNGQKPDVCSFQGREPIVCCPSSGQLPSQTTPTDISRPTPESQPAQNEQTTRPPTSKPSYWWASTTTEGGPVWGNIWTTKPSENKIEITTKNPPTLLLKSKADQMCQVYSQYVFRFEESPLLIPNQEPEKVKINECNIQTLIVGGVDAKPKEFPHMALIGYGETPNIEWLCGGSLISPKFVLSAAHCTRPNGRAAKWVRLGDLDTSIDNDDAEPVEVRIKKRINHPKYNNQVLYHDIALYELESEVKLGPYIRPLCLQSTKDIDSDTALASGWGHMSWGGRGSAMLQKVNLTLVTNQKCNQNFGRGEYRQQLPNGIDDENMLCAGGEQGKDTCQGDSGGPLQIERKDIYCMYSQIGVVSFGKGCALSYPGVYTRISSYLPWIERIVWP